MTGEYDRELLRSRLRDVRLGRVFRVIHRDRRTTPLRAAPAPSRFSDPQGRYAVLYASEAVRCAFWEVLGRNRFTGRALSAAVHANLPEADGFLFPSRFTGHACVAVFERAFGKLTALDIADLAAHVEFLDALDDYDIVLTEAPGSRG